MNTTLSQLTVKQDANIPEAFSLLSLAGLLRPPAVDNCKYELPDWPLFDAETTLPIEVVDLYKSMSEQTIWPKQQTAIFDFPSADCMRKLLQDRRNRRAASDSPSEEIVAPKKPVEKQTAGLLEVYSDRPFFRYSCSERSTNCSYGDLSVNCKVENKQQVVTYISALDVYDRYGLVVCSAYLHALYSAVVAGSYSGCSLLAYVSMSMAGLDMEGAQYYLPEASEVDPQPLPSRLSECCLTFLSLLSDYDKKQPRLASEIQQVTIELPVEVLAMICRSRRVSKRIGQHFLSLRLKQRSCMLREGELAARSLYTVSVQLGSRIWTSCSTMMVLQGDRAIVADSRDMSGVADRCNVAQSEVKVSSHLHSWKDYARLIGRDEKQVFIEVTNQVDVSDIAQLCSWILLLTDRHVILDSAISCAYKPMKELQSLTHSELRDLYSRLVDEVLAEYI
ncbi:Hypothetical protein POVR2_LOCUS214 [uncultured virus]|nr:Hypothetical protein POVR2_LOCUS214 [uncultured virus]